jgi:hypothetical protein
MEERRSAYRALVGKPEGGKNRLEDLRADWRTIFKWILKKLFGRACTGLILPRIGRRAVVNTAMNLRVPQNTKTVSSEELSAS